MKKLFLFLSFALLLVLPSLVVGQNVGNKVVVVGQPGQQTIGLTNDVINEVLTLAAPQFGFSFADFLRMYHTCGCITITEVGPGTYLVVYGGIGIQIVIDGCRQTTGNGGASPGGRK